MSYYQKDNHVFSYHGLQRCKERLGLKDIDDFQVHQEVMKLIRNSSHFFETKNEIYIAAGNTKQLYFVINKTNNLIITCTKISVEKQLTLIDR